MAVSKYNIILSISKNLLDNARAKEAENSPPGIYYLRDLYKSAIIVIHQLPRTPETLWLRLLGRGTVQQQAIQELESLPQTHRWRGNVIELVCHFLAVLALRQNPEADPDEEVLIVTLAQLYEEAIAQLQEETRQQEKLRFVTNLLRVRFGEVEEELLTIVEEIATLPSDEFTPLLLQLSREELLERFRKDAE